MIKLHGFSSGKLKKNKYNDPNFIKIKITGLRPGEKLEENFKFPKKNILHNILKYFQ